MSPARFTSLANDEKLQLIEALSAIINEKRQLLLQQILAQRTRHITVVLEDIYQSQNASAVIRSAECFGLQELHIIENRNEYQLNSAVVQGASKWIEINRYKDEQRDNTSQCIQSLKARGYRIIAMTLREGSKPIQKLEVENKLALCFGSEEPGLTDKAHEMADEYVQIPMYGFTQSFNLSVSAGISLYELLGRIRAGSINWQLDENEKQDLYIDWLSRSTPTGKTLLDRFEKEIAGAES